MKAAMKAATNNANRKPLIAMLALSAALAAPLAFAQVDTTSTTSTDPQTTAQAQETDIEAAQQAASDAGQQAQAEEAAAADMATSSDAAAAATTETETDAAAEASVSGAATSDAAATGAAMQGAQQETGTAGQQGWEELDADRDGSISRGEAAGNAGLTQIFDNADTDADGVLTAEEYRNFVNKNYDQPKSN